MKLLRTFNKLKVPLNEKNNNSKIAIDIIFDSISIGTTFKRNLNKHGVIFCSFNEATILYPNLVEEYLGTIVPYSDNFFVSLNSSIFSDGSFCFVPKDIECPLELSTYFRLNNKESGQFERTLIIAEARSKIIYLEGCTAPKHNINLLHTAVVELIALAEAFIQYCTIQN